MGKSAIKAVSKSAQTADSHKSLSTPVNLRRRRAVVALATGVPSLATVRSEGAMQGISMSKQITMVVESPKDGVVIRITQTFGKVTLGSLICEIQPDDEDRALDRIDLANQLLNLEENLLDPQNVAVRRSILEQGAIAAERNLALAKTIHKVGAGGEQLGAFPQHSSIPSEIAVVRAKAEHQKALASLELFDFNITQARMRLALYKQQLPKERSFVEKRIQRLRITAPADGILTILVGPDSFIKKGHPVATVTMNGPKDAI
jgi:hypothetical protein